MRFSIASRWSTAPISRTCEVRLGNGSCCGRPTVSAYKAMPEGWMALCQAHAQGHDLEAQPVVELLAKGEQWSNRW